MLTPASTVMVARILREAAGCPTRLRYSMNKILLIGGSLVIVVGLILGYDWVRGSKENTCPTLQSPVDTGLVTSVLYPGQLRGGEYKAHGGFRLDGLKTNDVVVRAPISAKLIRARRYIEIGELQYIFIFETDC